MIKREIVENKMSRLYDLQCISGRISISNFKINFIPMETKMNTVQRIRPYTERLTSLRSQCVTTTAC